MRILQYQLLSEPTMNSSPCLKQQVPSRQLFLPRRYESWPRCFRPKNRPIIRVEITLYLPHKLPTDLMLRCYLQETQPSPVKLLVMEVRICNSELLLHPIVLTLIVIPPPPTRSARHHASEQKKADPACPHRSPTCSVKGGCATRTRGSNISPNAADTPLSPQFPPTMVVAGLKLLLRRT